MEIDYPRAKDFCAHFEGGPSKDQRGWLVGVHDKIMDSFIQSLLKPDQKAFIGLFERRDRWEWVDNNPLSSSYLGWKSGMPQSQVRHAYDYVVQTKGGWENVRNIHQHGFICQMYPSFPTPTMTCPPSEEGKPHMPIECMIVPLGVYGDFRRLHINNDMRSPALICNSRYKCHYLLGNTVATISMTDKTLKTTVMVGGLASRDNDKVKWSCNPQFKKTYPSFLVGHCTMHTFVVPQSVECSHTISPKTGVSVVCHIRGVYPRAGSIWSRYIDGEARSVLQPKSEHAAYSRQDGVILYISRFICDITAPGQHKIEITVYPDVPFITEEAKMNASVERTVDFIISVPADPPVFSTDDGLDINNGFLTVDQGQAVVLVCEVKGGEPQVSQTSIECDGTYVRDLSGETSWNFRGQRASLKLLITRAMDQKVCTCRAQHVSKQYRETTTVTLDVPHPAEVNSFTVNQASGDEFEVTGGERAEFKCSSLGNPPPQLHLCKIDNKGKTQKILGKTFNTSISYDIAEVSCGMSGTYVCSAKNSLSKGTSDRRVNLKVRCPPQPCSMRDSDTEFSIVPGKAFNFKICLFVYPRPHPAVMISPQAKSNLDEKKYSASFVYTDDLETRGYVAVNMSSSVTLLGEYTLKVYQSSWHSIHFSLVPYQKPSCPESLTTLVGSTFVTLSWQPASDRGNPQTFTVYTIDDGGQVDRSERIKDGGRKLTLHNVTNLNPNSTYSFKLTVRNDQGVTECPNLMMNATTSFSQVSYDAVDNLREKDIWPGLLVGIVVCAIIVVIIVALVLVIALVKCKRRSRPNSTNESMNVKLNIREITDAQEGIEQSQNDDDPYESPYEEVSELPVTTTPRNDCGHNEARSTQSDEDSDGEYLIPDPGSHCANSEYYVIKHLSDTTFNKTSVTTSVAYDAARSDVSVKTKKSTEKATSKNDGDCNVVTITQSNGNYEGGYLTPICIGSECKVYESSSSGNFCKTRIPTSVRYNNTISDKKPEISKQAENAISRIGDGYTEIGADAGKTCEAAYVLPDSDSLTRKS